MNPFRVAAFAFAGLSFLVALIIGYRQWFMPWAGRKQTERERLASDAREATRVATKNGRLASVAGKPGRTQRIVPLSRRSGR